MNTSKLIDFRGLIKGKHGSYNASFIQCYYAGEERTFLCYDANDQLREENTFPPERYIGYIKNMRVYNDDSYAITFSNPHERNTEYIIPKYLFAYKVQESELIQMNGNKRVWID